MLAIWKREWKNYFQTVIGWLFVAVTLAVFALYFYVYNMACGYSNISYALSAITIIFVITVPVLTMKSFAEERHNKTDQLLLTAPISVGKVVWAKYLAVASVFTMCVAIIALMPLFLRIFGSISLAENYVSILGFWLFGLTCIAIGIFVSSLTENVVISAVLTFAVLFLGFMMSGIAGLISADGNVLTMVLNCFDLVTPMDLLMTGVLDVAGIVYYLSLILLFLFFTIESVQKRRWHFSSKKIGLGVFNGAMLVMGVALAVTVNLVANALPASVASVDLTRQGLYSITEDTKNYLEQLDEDINIYVLSSQKDADPILDKTLKCFEDASDYIHVEYKNPEKYPNFYQNYTEESISENSLIVESAKRSRVVDFNDIYVYALDNSSYSYVLSAYDGEGQIDSAIAYVTTEEMPVYYEITGHGEMAISGAFFASMEKGNISLEKMNLMDYEAIPDDAQAVIINGPTSDFSKDDRNKVMDYIKAGGNLFITTNYTDEDMENFYQILSEYSVTVVDGMVVENDSSAYYQYPYYVLPTVESTNWTYFLNGYIFAPFPQGMLYEESDDVVITPILSTSEQSVSKTDVKNVTTYEYEEEDTKGPFTIALYAETSADRGNGKAVIVSDASMFEDDANEIVSGTNNQLFTNLIASLDTSDTAYTNMMSVSSKSLESEYFAVPSLVVFLTAIIGIIVIPVLILVVGIVIWVRRRRK